MPTLPDPTPIGETRTERVANVVTTVVETVTLTTGWPNIRRAALFGSVVGLATLAPFPADALLAGLLVGIAMDHARRVK